MVGFFFQAEDGIRDRSPSRGLGDVYKRQRFANPFVAAEKGFIDEVISPSSTRKRISRAFAALRGKSLKNPWKKHDNIPL